MILMSALEVCVESGNGTVQLNSKYKCINTSGLDFLGQTESETKLPLEAVASWEVRELPVIFL